MSSARSVDPREPATVLNLANTGVRVPGVCKNPALLYSDIDSVSSKNP